MCKISKLEANFINIYSKSNAETYDEQKKTFN